MEINLWKELYLLSIVFIAIHSSHRERCSQVLSHLLVAAATCCVFVVGARHMLGVLPYGLWEAVYLVKRPWRVLKSSSFLLQEALCGSLRARSVLARRVIIKQMCVGIRSGSFVFGHKVPSFVVCAIQKW